MCDKPIFITQSQREQLTHIFKELKRLKEQISIEHEEYAAVDTSLYYLKNAIKSEKKYY